jgi:hypothetical protein
MFNFREFEAGPDPFGRTFRVYMKWLQTAISIRHADTVDVKFILEDEDHVRTEKTIALPHPFLLRVSGETKRPMDDAWCARIAALHLQYLITTGEDMEKDLVTPRLEEIQSWAAEIARREQTELQAR